MDKKRVCLMGGSIMLASHGSLTDLKKIDNFIVKLAFKE